MPEFILETAGGVPLPDLPSGLASHYWGSLDDFTQGYIEALFFISEASGIDREEFATAAYQARMDEGRADGCLPGDTGFADLSPDALAGIIKDCAEFQRAAAAPLAAAYGGSWDGAAKWGDYGPENGGRDLWFTRNGHGVGFWDRGLTGECDRGDGVPDNAGSLLSAMCGDGTPFSTVYPWWNAESETVELSAD